MESYKLEERAYDAKNAVLASEKAENPLEKILSSYTKMPEKKSESYNIDNCSCGNCFCLNDNITLILSPAGIATTVAAFGPISALS